jgi:hypothetical protein
MTCNDFRAWRDSCRQRFGMSDQQVADKLGCGINSVTRWKRYDPPYYIGLAVAAIEAGIKPWEAR